MAQSVTRALTLAAKLERAEYFVFFKKVQIKLLIDAGEKEKAKLEFADWDEIIPDDEDFKKLKSMVSA
ncbi:MAG: hypothetical protein FWH17_08685 [Oscillospiraceae bacterium]|nr:hypothetical protein [Oscillospiraceae bacterium]